MIGCDGTFVNLMWIENICEVKHESDIIFMQRLALKKKTLRCLYAYIPQ